MNRDRALKLMSCLFALAATYHTLAVALPGLGVPGVRWRHALFVVISAACSGLLLRRPPWFLPAYALLTVQQVYSHGWGVWLSWTVEQRVDWLALAVVVIVPFTLVLLAWDAREHGARRAT